MRVRVTPLRDRGRVMRRSELPTPLEGDLLVEDFPPHADRDRWKRRARLVAPDAYGTVQPSLLQPIFDVQLMKVDEGAMYLQGVERHSENGGEIITEVAQVWMCATT